MRGLPQDIDELQSLAEDWEHHAAAPLPHEDSETVAQYAELATICRDEIARIEAVSW